MQIMTGIIRRPILTRYTHIITVSMTVGLLNRSLHFNVMLFQRLKLPGLLYIFSGNDSNKTYHWKVRQRLRNFNN